MEKVLECLCDEARAILPFLQREILQGEIPSGDIRRAAIYKSEGDVYSFSTFFPGAEYGRICGGAKIYDPTETRKEGPREVHEYPIKDDEPEIPTDLLKFRQHSLEEAKEQLRKYAEENKLTLFLVDF